MNPVMARGAMPKPAEKSGAETSEAGAHTKFEPKGDGSVTLHHHPDGSKTEHPTVGHALMHLAHEHGDGGKHMHVHHGEGGEVTTHHVGEDGEVEGPHEHGSVDEAGEHMKSVMGDEDEGSDEHDGEEPETEGMY